MYEEGSFLGWVFVIIERGWVEKDGWIFEWIFGIPLMACFHGMHQDKLLFENSKMSPPWFEVMFGRSVFV